jgi:hypothetical protein
VGTKRARSLQGADGVFDLLQFRAKLLNNSCQIHDLLFPAIQRWAERHLRHRFQFISLIFFLTISFGPEEWNWEDA